MTTPDPLQCTYEDARHVHLRQGITLSTSAKIAFFEEMVTFAASFGARDRLAGRRVPEPDAATRTRTSDTHLPSRIPGAHND